MEGSAKLKVPGGKLVSVKVRYSQTIDDVRILGDFFLHPEESLARMETCLVGMPSDSGSAAIAGRISEAAFGVEMIGITPLAIAEAIRMAME